jgi:hypothetical protein
MKQLVTLALCGIFAFAQEPTKTLGGIVTVPRGRVEGSAFLIAAQLGDLAWPVCTISERSLLQVITPTYLLGRVNSSMHLLFHGVLPLGALVGGAIAQSAGMWRALLIGAIGVLLSTMWLVFSRYADCANSRMPLAK